MQIAKEHGALILSRLDGTIGSLRNHGAEHAKGHILAFVDADCQVPKNWLTDGVRHFDQNDVAVAGCRLCHDVSTWVAKSWSLIHSENIVVGETDWVPSGSMLVSRYCFHEVKGFDEGLSSSEDYDLCLRVRSQGYKVVSDPKISAIHLDPPKTLFEFYKKELWHGRGMLKTSSTQNLKPSRALLYAIFYLLSMIGIVFGLMMSLLLDTHVVLIFFTVTCLFIPFLLAAKTTLLSKSYKYIFSLTLMYVVYGLARSVCLVNLHKLRTHEH
jgi:GT2 family glycosyltransferase